MLLKDFETYSEARLGKHKEAVTAASYAEHPSTEVLCMGYKFGEAPSRLWIPDREPFPEEISAYYAGDGPIYAWNVGFEAAICKYTLKLDIAPHRWRDIMAAAAYASMPQSLDEFSNVAGLPVVKDMAGHKAMQKITRPRRPTKNNPATRWTYETAREDFEKTYAYCVTDIDVEYLAYKMLRWTPLLSF